MKKLTSPWIQVCITVLVIGFLTISCKSTRQKTIAKAPSIVVPEPQNSPALVALPETPAKTVLPTIEQKPSVDPIAALIQKSQESFFRGEKNLKAGFLEKAKRDFDESLEIILRSGIPLSQDERLERQYESLIDKIHNYELAVLKQGDGFNEEALEEAPLDEISSGEVPLTFNPKSKQLAEETIKEIPHDLPLPINDLVLRYIDFFQNHGRKALEIGMQRAGRYRDMISRILSEEDLPQDLIYLCQAESAFRPLAYSRAKCKGLWQFGSGTGSLYGLRQNWWIDERSDPEKSTRAAARHLKDLYNQFGDWLLVMAAYNWGAGGVERAIGYTGYADYWELLKRHNLPAETKDYIPIILAITIISKNPSKYGFDVNPDPAAASQRVPMASAVDLRLVAESLDLSLSEIQELNPHVKRLTTPHNDPDFNLYVPVGMGEKLLQEIVAIPEDMRVNWRKHRVEEGETLTDIARKYRTTAFAIAQANNLHPGERIQFGKKLIIPVTPGKGSRAEQAALSGSKVRYKVQRGDTIATIARDFDVTIAQIRRWNNLGVGSQLRPGRILAVAAKESSLMTAQKVPGSNLSDSTLQSESKKRVVHRVKRGDTLFAIASNYGTTIDSIRDWNNLSSKASLKVGERLTIYVSR